MLLADFMERPDDGSLEKRPRAFHVVCVNIAPNPFFGAVRDPFVTSSVVRQVAVGDVLVGKDGLSVFADVLVDELPQGDSVRPFGGLHSHFALAFYGSQDNCLVSGVASSLVGGARPEFASPKRGNATQKPITL